MGVGEDESFGTPKNHAVSNETQRPESNHRPHRRFAAVQRQRDHWTKAHLFRENGRAEGIHKAVGTVRKIVMVKATGERALFRTCVPNAVVRIGTLSNDPGLTVSIPKLFIFLFPVETNSPDRSKAKWRSAESATV